MSAIAGIYYPDGRPVEPPDPLRMIDSMARRGPDRVDVWCAGEVGLAHRMLWTTPESLHEQLPLADATGNLVITADARVDNRAELLELLDLTSRPAAQVSDSELILRAYERWGEACLARLLGDFAFAIWDRRARRLFCARDHMGIRPFYYHGSAGIFAFSSEIKGLLRLPEVPRRLNEVRVVDFLLGLMEDQAITFYRDIWRLPPAHFLVADPDGIRLQRYWQLDPNRELHFRTDDDYAEALRDLFTEAVRCRLRSAFPTGSMLSGGLDSSSIVCVARRLLAEEGRPQLRTYSTTYEGSPECTDAPYIQDVLALGGLEPYILKGDRIHHFDRVGEIFDCHDEPYWDHNMHATWRLMEIIGGQGTRVMLDGTDGDTTLAYSLVSLADLFRAGRWWDMGLEMSGIREYFPHVTRRYLLRNYLVSPLLPETLRRLWRMVYWRNELGAWPRRCAVISPAFVERIVLTGRLEALLGERASPARTARQDHARALDSGRNTYHLELLGRAAAAVGTELRFPFYDRRLIEFGLALPAEQKLHRGLNRPVMRHAMAGILPESVRWRGGKGGYTTTLTHDMLENEPEVLESIMGEEGQVLDPYVDRTVLRTVLQRYRGKIQADRDRTAWMADEQTVADARNVWKSVSLALWLNHSRLQP